MIHETLQCIIFVNNNVFSLFDCFIYLHQLLALEITAQFIGHETSKVRQFKFIFI